jgi:hypothetical protein
VTYQEAAAALRMHYGVTESRDVAKAELRLAHLDKFFLGYRLAAITTASCETYAGKRQAEEAANGTINRELAVLGRMLRLAHEDNRDLQAALPSRSPTAGAGTRSSRYNDGSSTSRPGPYASTPVTKNDDGREVDLTDELHTLLAAQVERVKVLERQLGRVVPYLFPHLRGPAR